MSAIIRPPGPLSDCSIHVRESAEPAGSPLDVVALPPVAREPPEIPPSVTIIDVAKRAGVSMKTVSRVLNEEPRVRAEVRERVALAAKELHYRPKVSARSLAGSRSYVVGYLLNDPSIPYYGYAQLGALRACRKAGYHLLVESVDLGAPDLRAEIDRLVGDFAVDGFLLVPPLCDNLAILDALDDAEAPYVRISPAVDPGRSALVECDDRRAATEMTLHLMDLGHRRIGFVVGDPRHSAAHHRLEGYRHAHAQRGMAVDGQLIHQGYFTFRSGYDAAEALLASPDRPTAIFASNDAMALGVMAAAQALALSTPRDLSVAGFDDTASASMVWPALTTVRQPIVDMAEAATEMIIERSTRKARPAQSPQLMLHCDLVLRGSTAAPPGA